jgi:hypothetical protein
MRGYRANFVEQKNQYFCTCWNFWEINSNGIDLVINSYLILSYTFISEVPGKIYPCPEFACLVLKSRRPT